MFKTARGWGVVGAADPTAGLAKPAKEAPRDRILFDGAVLVGPDPRLNELGRLVGALIAEPSPLPVRPPTRAAFMLTLRLGSVRSKLVRSNGGPSTSRRRALHHCDEVEDGRRLAGAAAAARRGRDIAGI